MNPLQTLIAFINQWIYTNGNNEITAATLNPVLQAIAQWANGVMGDPSTLNTSTQASLVAAINEINGALSGISNAGIKIYNGTTDPNETPPPSFNNGDFYMLETSQGSPVELYQYDGYTWAPQSSNTYDGSNLPAINPANGETEMLNGILQNIYDSTGRGQNKVITVTLDELGVGSFNDVTPELMADFIANANVSPVENYEFEVLGAIPEPVYDFEVGSNDWGAYGWDTQAGFEASFVPNNFTGAIISDYIYSDLDLAIKCNVSGSPTELRLGNAGGVYCQSVKINLPTITTIEVTGSSDLQAIEGLENSLNISVIRAQECALTAQWQNDFFTRMINEGRTAVTANFDYGTSESPDPDLVAAFIALGNTATVN